MRFFWRIQKRFVISDHMDSSLPKKWKIQKLRIIYHDNGMSSCSLWKKKQHTDPHGEDKKKKKQIWNDCNWVRLECRACTASVVYHFVRKTDCQKYFFQILFQKKLRL